MQLRAPRPALVISFVALLVALSATAYAATKITKSSQIKNGIITSSDIKNKTIKTADLAKSTLKRIDKLGTTNTLAIEGVRKSGPVSQPANQQITIASLTIPAGAYVITGKTTLAGSVTPPNLFKPAITATGTCRLNAGGDEDVANTTIVTFGQQSPGTMYMQTTRTLGGSAAITIRCASNNAFSASDTSIIAQRISSNDKKNIG